MPARRPSVRFRGRGARRRRFHAARGPSAGRHRGGGRHRRDGDGAHLPDHVRQRAGALLHRRLVRVHRGVLGVPDGRADARRRLRRLRAKPAHPHGVLRRQARRGCAPRRRSAGHAVRLRAVRRPRLVRRQPVPRRLEVRHHLARHRHPAVDLHRVAAAVLRADRAAHPRAARAAPASAAGKASRRCSPKAA